MIFSTKELKALRLGIILAEARIEKQYGGYTKAIKAGDADLELLYSLDNKLTDEILHRKHKAIK